MKKLISLCLFAVCVIPAAGQRLGNFGGRASGGARFGRGGFARGFGPGPFRQHRYFSNILTGPFYGGFGFNGFSPFGYGGFPFGYGGLLYPYDFPLFAGGYDYEYPSNGYSASPSIVIMQQPFPQVVASQAPREVLQPVIHDYQERPAAAAASPPATGAESTFVIALNDGGRLAASAVWLQDNTLHYIDTDDRRHEVPLTSIDRELTRRLNQERKLDLRLPAP